MRLFYFEHQMDVIYRAFNNPFNDCFVVNIISLFKTRNDIAFNWFEAFTMNIAKAIFI
jgi:hypothetical protein